MLRNYRKKILLEVRILSTKQGIYHWTIIDSGLTWCWELRKVESHHFNVITLSCFTLDIWVYFTLEIGKEEMKYFYITKTWIYWSCTHTNCTQPLAVPILSIMTSQGYSLQSFLSFEERVQTLIQTNSYWFLAKIVLGKLCREVCTI